MPRELSRRVADCFEHSLEAERCAQIATDLELRAGYRRLATQWRDLAETLQFIERLEQFLKSGGRSALQRPQPSGQSAYAPDIGWTLNQDTYIPSARPRPLED